MHNAQLKKKVEFSTFFFYYDFAEPVDLPHFQKKWDFNLLKAHLYLGVPKKPYLWNFLGWDL